MRIPRRAGRVPQGRFGTRKTLVRLSYELIFQNEARNDVDYWRILEANRGNRMSNNNDTSNWWALLAVPFMAAGCFVQLLIMGFVLFVAVSVFLWFVGLF